MLGIFKKFKEGFAATREKCLSFLGFNKTKSLDPETLSVLEKNLYAADFGPETTQEILKTLREQIKKNVDLNWLDTLKNILKEKLKNAEGVLSFNDREPQVVVLLGINGTGKTTTAAKLAFLFQEENRRVILGSCDTFRAAANEQLRLWADRLKLDLVGSQAGSDAAAVAYDTCAAGISRKCDMVVLDTAGRLHTKSNLMGELKKLTRVLGKFGSTFPQHKWLVIDGSLGSNSLEQAKTFHREIGLTGIIVTKLDGTGKGGALLNIYRQLQLPIYFIGLGENPEDLQPFLADNYVDALFAIPQTPQT